MLLGLHDRPLVMALGAVALIVLLFVGAIAAQRQRLECAGIVAPLMYFGAVIVFVVGTIVVLSGERTLDTRDAIIETRLADAEVAIVEFEGWGERVVVKSGDCTASYLIQPEARLLPPKTWPLVAGTGRAISNCSVGDLNKRFETH